MNDRRRSTAISIAFVACLLTFGIAQITRILAGLVRARVIWLPEEVGMLLVTAMLISALVALVFIGRWVYLLCGGTWADTDEDRARLRRQYVPPHLDSLTHHRQIEAREAAERDRINAEAIRRSNIRA